MKSVYDDEAFAKQLEQIQLSHEISLTFTLF